MTQRIFTFTAYHDDDTGVLRGHWWPEVREGDQVIPPPTGWDGVVRTKSFLFKCSATRAARNRAEKLARDVGGIITHDE